MNNKELISAAARLAAMAVLLLNMILTIKGINPLPFDENAFTELITEALAAVSVLWGWWKNNNITYAACRSQAMLDVIKADGVVEYSDQDCELYEEDAEEE